MPNIPDDIISSQPTVVDDEDKDEGELAGQVFMGDKLVRNARPIINARKEAFTSGILSRVIARVCQPSDMRIQGKAHQHAIEELKEWAKETTADVLRKELSTHAKSTKVGDVEREVVNEESLKDLTFDSITEEVQANAPTLYSMLVKICESSRQERNTQKDSKFVSTREFG